MILLPELHLSVWSGFFYALAVVVVLDAMVLVLAAQRSSRRVAMLSGLVGLAAALGQAIWVYIPFRWDVLPPFGDGVLWFGSAVAAALMLAVALLVRRGSRVYGYAVLVGSAQGFVGMFGLILATFAACNCWD